MNVSYVSTFVDMARVVLADRHATARIESCLAKVGAEHEPPDGWESRVISATVGRPLTATPTDHVDGWNADLDVVERGPDRSGR
jgi:hypothetical protein